jgi:hypothetical protein
LGYRRRVRTALLLMALLLARAAWPCSCNAPPPPAKALARAGAVFSGTVVKAERVSNDGKRSDFDAAALKRIEEEIRQQKPIPDDRFEVTFAVESAWKGVDAPTVVLTSALPICCICLIAFEKGQQWLIYADRGSDGSGLSTGHCSRSTDLKQAQADLKALGKPGKTFSVK